MIITKINHSLTAIISILCIFLLSSTVNAGSWRSETRVGGKLKTHVYVPDSTSMINEKRALMVSMHGCGQTHDQFKTGANWPNAAEEYGMVVALPLASKEGLYGALLGCWNFHVGMNAARSKTDAKYLIDMVNALLSDASLNIDPDQVYITGLSSGAGMTNQMACLAPDIFAGAGVNAGPAPGSNGTDLQFLGISVSKGKDNCEKLAGSFKNDLYTQVYNNVHGTSDALVNKNHAQRNTDIFVEVYEAGGTTITACSSGSIAGSGDEDVYCDDQGPRLSRVMVNGMGHAWPAGPGSFGGGSYINHNKVNYPNYIAKFFTDNNRRAGGVIATPTPTPIPGTPTPTPVITPTPTPVITPTPQPTVCNEFTSNNSGHLGGGRAVRQGFTYYTNGSNENLGIFSFFPNTTLRETTPGYFEKGNCP